MQSNFEALVLIDGARHASFGEDAKLRSIRVSQRIWCQKKDCWMEKLLIAYETEVGSLKSKVL